MAHGMCGSCIDGLHVPWHDLRVNHFKLLPVLLSLLAIAGCGDDDRSLCPSCRAGYGGETGDLDDLPPAQCKERREPIARDDDSFDPAPGDVLPFVERELGAPLQWVVREGAKPT